jgi:hypothetical protein
LTRESVRRRTAGGIRRKVELAYRKYRAIRILTNTLDRDARAQVDQSLAALRAARKRKLIERYPEVERALSDVAQRFGAKGTLREMEYITEMRREEGDHLFVPKHVIEELFDHYERALPTYPRLPPHARLAIDVFGVRESAKEMSVFLLEGSLFEDMAALWNSACELSGRFPDIDAAPRLESKKHNALIRATAKSAFNMVEGYLNCLSYDILLTATVTERQRALLEERAAGRFRPVSLRDKILQYPKIAARLPQPPITEQNSAELRFILNLEQVLRHALIHPTPRPLLAGGALREAAYQRISAGDVATLCDATVALIRRIAAAVGPSFGDVSLWLFDRGADGRYPDSTFL